MSLRITGDIASIRRRIEAASFQFYRDDLVLVLGLFLLVIIITALYQNLTYLPLVHTLLVLLLPFQPEQRARQSEPKPLRPCSCPDRSLQSALLGWWSVAARGAMEREDPGQVRLKESFTDTLIWVLDNQGLVFRQRPLTPCMCVQQPSHSQQ